jgi:alpha-D-xyloside xylohydrolase
MNRREFLGTSLSAGASTNQVQEIAKVRIYPGADGDFTLYTDDAETYAYQKNNSITYLHWGKAARNLSESGVLAWKISDQQILEITGRYAERDGR